MNEIEYAYAALTGQIKVNQWEMNRVDVIVKTLLAEMLQKEDHCVYCTKPNTRRPGNKTYFTINGDIQQIHFKDKIVDEFRIRRCPFCGNRLEQL